MISPVSAAPLIGINSVPKKTGNTSVDALLTGGTQWWHDSANVAGTPDFATGMSNAKHALTYSFMAAADSGQANDTYGFQAMNAQTQQAVRDALAEVAKVADITFTEDTNGGGNLQFGTNAQRYVSAGYAYYPNSRSADKASVYIANDAYNQATTDWSPGTNAFGTLLHEIGHALGLKHPGAYNAGGGKAPAPYLKKAEDNTRYTQMSYNPMTDGMVAKTTVQGNGLINLGLRQVRPETYQMDDIAALQYLYGRSKGASETQAQQYSFTDADPEFMATVSNSNGNSIIDASATTRNNVLDLRAGHFSSIGMRDPYAALSAPFNTPKSWAQNVHSKVKPTYTGQNNFGIAAGSHIDNAAGGAGNDLIVGNNDAANSIDAGGGNDMIYLGQANSTVEGGNGVDTVLLPKLKNKWTVDFDANTGTYTVRNGSITSVLHGVETIKGWDGQRTIARALR